MDGWFYPQSRWENGDMQCTKDDNLWDSSPHCYQLSEFSCAPLVCHTSQVVKLQSAFVLFVVFGFEVFQAVFLVHCVFWFGVSLGFGGFFLLDNNSCLILSIHNALNLWVGQYFSIPSNLVILHPSIVLYMVRF
jgi:hypothetical protein